MIRIDAVWLAVAPIDMRAGADGLLARVVQVFGAAQAHHGYLFANARGTRIKLLVHDGFGVWCAARRLNAGSFVWPRTGAAGGAHAERDNSTRWCWVCPGNAWSNGSSSRTCEHRVVPQQLADVPMDEANGALHDSPCSMWTRSWRPKT